MSILSVLLALLLSSNLLLLSSAKSITLSLSRLDPTSTNPLENLKCHNDTHLSLYPRSSDRRYSVNLSFGTPLQNLSLIMDTSSGLVWVPCTNNYNCTNCQPSQIPITFTPESSSSSKSITCTSHQCKWLSYPHCINNTKCGYSYGYGPGYTTGRLLTDKLAYSGLQADDFIMGCSVSSNYMFEEGIVGFGRGPVSFPAQLNLTSFSYCLVSHHHQYNTTASSDLVLTTSRGGCKDDPATNYTPFVSNSAHPDYYYVSLESISIGCVHINVPFNYRFPDAKGYGGTTLDSHTTYTQMGAPVFDLVFRELDKQVGNRYERAINIEDETYLTPCYNVGKNKTINLPQFTFHFQGNTNMVMPLANSFAYFNESVVCMTIMSWGEVELYRGPAIIVGTYQQQDFYMEYDLECNRLGIRQQKCI